ncbi:MAG TPA: hypothetical protein VJ731_16045 [Terriglobales bacterium]|nr:hypothetical protein [Terriglobales bacterium]
MSLRLGGVLDAGLSRLLCRHSLRALFALPAGIGDVATGLVAAFVAYAWYSGKLYGRSDAIAWNLFGMADLVNAVVLAMLTGAGAGFVFPLALVPAYGVSRSLLIHSYSLVGLLRKTSEQPRRAESLHYGTEAAGA